MITELAQNVKNDINDTRPGLAPITRSTGIFSRSTGPFSVHSVEHSQILARSTGILARSTGPGSRMGFGSTGLRASMGMA